MRYHRWREPAGRVRPGAKCLTRALRIAHAYTHTHGGSDGYSHSYGDVYIHAYTDGHSDVDTYSNDSAYAYGYGHSHRNGHADADADASLQPCLRVRHRQRHVRARHD
jgi:hypothetical protein